MLIETTDKQQDELAEAVLDRYRRAREYRGSYIAHQSQSAQALFERAEHQYRREYTPDEIAIYEGSFGVCPSRYMGVTQQKVNAAVAWHMDLVVNNLDNMFTVTPSPEPTLDKASIERIRRGVRRELLKKMADANIADPLLLLDADGNTSERIQDYLHEQTIALRNIERARIIALANGSATRMQTRMRDRMIEGDFRQAYAGYTFDRYLYGIGFMKFPDYQRRIEVVHSGRGAKREWVVKPWFRHVPVLDFYPICDAKDLQTNTGNTEHTFVTKAELISMARQKEYFTDQIETIIDEYAYTNRNWLDQPDSSERESWWGLDDTIPLLIHEGFFSGSELAEYGVTGIDRLDYVSARVEVCGHRTIRCELITLPGGAERTYFGAPHVKTGTNLYDVLGLGAQLYDVEQRCNVMMHLFENNADWASRPPILRNREMLSDPSQADFITPGGQYDVEERIGITGSMPDVLRPMNTVSAQYHLLLTQVGTLLRMADEDSGIPAFAYSSQDFGRASLGEYSQRMSNALRTIKMSALNEDMYFIEPTFRGLFQHEITTDRELAEGQDVNCVIRGMTGLLKEDLQAKRQEQMLPMLLNAPPGLIPEVASQYAAHELLKQAGVPLDALGISDPLIDQALAVAASRPADSLVPGGPQVPQLDGRSGAAAVAPGANPMGQSNFSIPSPSLGG